MRRPLCAILAALTLVINLAGAHESRHQSSEPTDPFTPASSTTLVNLLQESHDLAQQLPVSTRIALLTRQAEMVSRLRADLAQEWAHELFTLSFQAREDLRAFVQNNAMAILVRLDPDRALEMLHSMSPEELQGTMTTSQLELALHVFNVLVERDGVSALPYWNKKRRSWERKDLILMLRWDLPRRRPP